MNSGCAYGFPIDFFFLYVVLKNLTRFRTTLVNYEAELLDGLLENYSPIVRNLSDTYCSSIVCKWVDFFSTLQLQFKTKKVFFFNQSVTTEVKEPPELLVADPGLMLSPPPKKIPFCLNEQIRHLNPPQKYPHPFWRILFSYLSEITAIYS